MKKDHNENLHIKYDVINYEIKTIRVETKILVKG